MTVHLVTFSDESMSRARELCASSAKRNSADKAHIFDPIRLSMMGYECLTFEGRGLGFWKWKPAVIGLVLRSVNENDIVIYADAGIEFINNVNYIIDRMGHDRPQDDVWLFGNSWEHAHWCKRDVVEEVWPMTEDQWLNSPIINPVELSWSRFGKQVQASVIFFRVSDYSRQFVAEWLKWCLFEGRRLIDDSPSRLPNHPEFKEHRHDQAILTTMAYREGIKLHWWPAMYNDGAFTYEKLPEYAGDDYPVLFHHHRRRDHEWK